MTSRQQRVFISYSRGDTALAREVRGWLLETGQAPWMDLFDIPAGVRWPDAIDRALRSANIVLGVMSSASLSSDNVKNEWDWAIANRKRLVLLLTEQCEIPFHYVSLNYLDFTTSDRTAAYAQLGSALESAVATEPIPVPDDETDTTLHTRTSRLRAALGRGPASRTAIVGRNAERDMVRQSVTRAIEGEGSLLLIGGEAGIGKTTLVTDVGREAEERGFLALTGGCYDLSTTPPYGPWVQILAAYQPSAGMPLVPETVRDEAGLQSIPSQAALFEVIGEFFAEVAERQPLLLVLEDLHWTDPASLDFLRFLCRFLAGLPILVVVTYREDELTRRHPLWDLLPILVREAPSERLSLRRLDASAIRELITTRYHLSGPDEDRLVAHLLRLAEGNPFFTRELLQSLEEDGLLKRETSGWALGDLIRTDVPPLVRQVIERRLDRLDAATREQLQLAAVIGHDIPYDLWSAVSDLAESGLLAAVEQAIDARLIEELPGGQGVRFYHALVRESLYDGVVSLRRRAWHRRVAETLIATSAPAPDIVAYHLEQSGDPRLADWLIRAGEHAERRWAWIMAAERFDQAQRLIENMPNRGSDRAWLLLHIGLLQRYGDPAEGVAYLQEARRIAADLGDPLLAAYALTNHGVLECFAGSIRQGIIDMEAGLAALDELDRVGDPTFSATHRHRYGVIGVDGWGTLAAWLAIAGWFHHATEAVARRRAQTSDKDAADAFQALGVVYAIGQGNPDLAREALRQSRELFLNVNDRSQAAYDLMVELTTVMRPYATTQVEERRRLAQEARALSVASISSIPTFFYDVDFVFLVDWFLSGNWTGLRKMTQQFLHESWAFNGVFSRVLYYTDDKQSLRKWFDSAFPEGSDTQPGDHTFLDAVELQLVAADLALDADDLSTARAWLDAHDRWMDWADAVLGRAEGHLSWARYWQLSGDLSKARQHADLALSHASDPRQPLAQIAAHRFIGQLATEDGNVEDAERHLTQSLDLADACRAPFERALTLLDIAGLDIVRDDADAARSKLADARTIFESLEARPALERLAALEVHLS